MQIKDVHHYGVVSIECNLDVWMSASKATFVSSITSLNLKFNHIVEHRKDLPINPWILKSSFVTVKKAAKQVFEISHFCITNLVSHLLFNISNYNTDIHLLYSKVILFTDYILE